MSASARRFLASLTIAAFTVANGPGVLADPYPPNWGGAAVHHPPVAWPAEPADPTQCGAACGEWKPYTRFQGGVTDPRTQDPSNGGTAPQNYVNIASSCVDKSLPSIYYALKQGATPAQDVILFRWRVEQIANTYATGPSAGAHSATDPWSSALWSVLFDIDGDGFIDLAAHLDGSSGAPSVAIDRIAGIWSKRPTQSLDYLNDPLNVSLIAHNPTAFVDPATSRLLNFNPATGGSHAASPDANWPNGASETTWDYGTTRSKVVRTSPCNEYFVDYQIPVALLDASAQGGPKITRSSPMSMLFCTANSLNNPFQKDCALNNAWTGGAGKPAPFGDYVSFDQPASYAQPIVSKVTATPPASCPGTYQLAATVQDTLAVMGGNVVTSVKAVKFFHYYDTNGNGVADDGNTWTFAADATLKPGSLTAWSAGWDASALPRGQYLIGVQALDDNTKVDLGVTPSGVDNRTFSYVTGDAANRIYIAPTSYVALPTHSPAMSPSAAENWYGNPSVTGTQTALVGTAVNTCGPAPTLAKAASTANVAPGGAVDFTLTLANPLASAITLSQLADALPSGFAYALNHGGSLAPTGSPTAGATGTVAWTFSPAATVAAGATATLAFRATASATAGNYTNTASATTSFGTLASGPVAVAVDAARLSLTKTPGTYLATANGSTQLTYTLRYANPSSVAVTGAQVTDVLPAGVAYVTCTGGSACGNSGGTVTWTLGTLAAGASGTATLVVTVNASYASTSLANTASLSGQDPAGNAVGASDTATVSVNVPLPSVVFQKSGAPGAVAPGANVTYTLSFANNGASTINNVVMTDPIPAGFTYVGSSGGGTPSGGVVTWNYGNIGPGGSASCTVTLKADNPFTATNPQTNTGSLTWTGNATPLQASVKTGVTQSGNVCNTYYFRNATAAVGFDGTKQVARMSPVPVAGDAGTGTTITVPGGSNNFSSTILSFYSDPSPTSDLPLTGNLTTNMYIDRNPGPGIEIRATVYDYNSITGARTQLGQSTTAFGGSQSGLLTFTVPVGGTLLHDHRLLWTFEATSANSQSTPILFQYGGTVNNSISDTTAPIATTFANSSAQICSTPPANLVLDKSVDKLIARPGDTVTYTIAFSNTSTTTAATGATIVETLPAGLTLTSSRLNGSNVTPTGTNPYTYAVNTSGQAAGTVAAAASGNLVIQAAVDNPLAAGITSLANVATIRSSQTSDFTDTATSAVENRTGSLSSPPAIAVQLAADRASAVPGQAVTYTITVANVGGSDATGVSVADVLPIASYYTAGTCSNGCTGTTTFTWNVGTLAAGASATRTFTMVAGSSGLPAGLTVIPDAATASATGLATVTSNTVNVVLNGNPSLSLAKSASPNAGLKAGDTVTYSMLVTNTGNATASGLTVVDPLPTTTPYKGTPTFPAGGTGSYDPVANRVTFTLPSLAAGASATFGFQATVGPLAAGATTITNTANASASNAPAVQGSTGITASAAPVLTLTKNGPAQSAYPAATLVQAASGPSARVNDATQLAVGQWISIGGTAVQVTAITGTVLTLSGAVAAASGTPVVGAITYALAWQNTGDATATSVTLTDTLPAGSTFAAASNGGTHAAGVVTWSIASLAAGEGGAAQVTILPGGAGTISNNASITCAACNTATANAATAVGGLVVTKRTSTPTASAGGTATYTIDVANTSGAPIANVSVTDVLSPGFTYASTTTITNDGAPVAAGSSPVVGDGTLAWGTFTVAAGKVLRVTFVANVAATVGAATYQNLAGATPTASTVPFDPLATTAEDVTVLAAGTGLVEGVVFRDLDNNGAFDPLVDTPLANVRLTITDGSSTTYTLVTDANGYYGRVVAAGLASIDVSNADIPGGFVLGAGFTDPAAATVPAGGRATADVGYLSAAALPDLAIAKSHSGTWSQGGTGSYTITVSNVGAGATTGTVTVVDTLPTGLVATAVSGTGWSCTLATLTCTRSDALGAGASYPALTLSVSIAANAAASVTNTATVSGGGELNAANDTATDPTTIAAVLPQADLAITKGNGGASVTAGTSTSYSIVVSNAGPAAADGAVVTDAAAAGLAKTSATCGSATGGAVCPTTSVAGLEAGLAIPTLPSGGSLAFTVAATVTASAGANVTNTATVAAPAGTVDPNNANNTASDTDSVVAAPLPQADLSITKTNGVTGVTTGTATTYTIVVANAGPAAANGAVVTDAVASGLSKASAACGSATGGAACPATTIAALEAGLAIPTLPAGGSLAFTVVANVTAAAGSNVTNTATVAAPAGTVDPNAGDNSASDTDAVVAAPVPQADLSITKTNGVAGLTAGATTTYAIVVANAGPAAANGAVVTDPSAAGLVKSSASCGSASGGAACPASTTVAGLEAGLAVPTLPAGGSVTFTVAATVTAAAGGSVTNVATVASPAGTADPNAANNAASDTDAVSAPPVPQADLSITKSNGGSSVTSGTTTTYSIVVANGGPAAAHGAVVTDAAAAGLAKSSAMCGTPTGGAVCPVTTVPALEAGLAIPAMPAGGTLTFTVVASVTAAAGATITNVASVAPPAGTNDPDPADNSASDTDSVVAAPLPQADLAVTKTNGVASVTSGAATTYTIVVTNAGPAAANGAVLADAAATGLTKTSVACGSATGGAVCPGVGIASLESGVAIPTLPAGGALTFTVVATVTSPGGTSITNSALVAVPAGIVDPNASNNTATDTDAVVAAPVPQADLSVTKGNGGASVTAGASTTYTIVVANAGPAAANGARLTDPAATGLAKASVACGTATGGASCPAVTVAALEGGVAIPLLPAGGSLTFTVVANVTAAAGANVTNTATVAAPAGTVDPNPANNTASDTDAVVAAPLPQADLSVTKTNGTTSVVAGAATTYTIVVANAGPAAANGARLTDAVATGLTKTGASCAIATGGAVCPATSVAALESGLAIATLPAGGSLTFTVVANVTAAAGGAVINAAIVAAPAGVTDPNPADNTASDTDTVGATPPTQADLATSITNGVAGLAPAATTTYTVLVTNAGPASADGAVLTVPAVAGLAKGSVACSSATGGAACPATSVAGVEAGLVLPTLPPGGAVTLLVGATVSATTGNVTATANVAPPAGRTDPNLANNAGSDTDPVSVPANGWISGRVWYDANRNRIADANEGGFAGWTVQLLLGGNVIATATSDAQGNYRFTGLGAGTYTVRFSQPTASGAATGVNGDGGASMPNGGTPGAWTLANIVLTSNGTSVDNCARQSLPIDPSGVVYDSQVRTPVAGATVTLQLNGATAPANLVAGGATTVVTGADGAYAFFLLPAAPAGTYGLVVSAPGKSFPSTFIAPSAAPGGFTGGQVTPVPGAPPLGAPTTYYVQFPRPTIDLTNNHLPVDPRAITVAEVPTLGEWALLLLGLLVVSAPALSRRRA